MNPRFIILRLHYCLAILLLTGLIGCSEPDPMPRKLAYPRIDLPAHTTYATFRNEACPFTFEYPDYGEISRDMADSCWVDIRFSRFNCKWHISYHDVQASDKNLDEHYEEWRSLIFKHSKKASRIQDKPVSTPLGKGFFYEVYGDVGTPAQFFFSDSSGNEVVMTSFYFRTALKNDSLAPVIDYMKGELQHMIESIRWEK